jgi:hypothetical protein
MQILEHWDFSFVHQVLSVLRLDEVNESVSAGLRNFQPKAPDRNVLVQPYAPAFLEAGEAAALRKESKREYCPRRARGPASRPAFWQHHKKGLKTLGETADCPYLALQLGRELLG